MTRQNNIVIILFFIYFRVKSLQSYNAFQTTSLPNQSNVAFGRHIIFTTSKHLRRALDRVIYYLPADCNKREKNENYLLNTNTVTHTIVDCPIDIADYQTKAFFNKPLKHLKDNMLIIIPLLFALFFFYL